MAIQELLEKAKQESEELEGRLLKLIDLIAEVSKLRREAEELRRMIEHEIFRLAPPELARSLAPLVSSLSVPELPEAAKSVEELEQALLEYSRTLRDQLMRMRRCAEDLRRLLSLLEHLERLLPALDAWVKLINGFNAHLAAEASRALTRALRAKEGVASKSLSSALKEVSEAIAEVQEAIRTCKNAYERRLAELERLICAAESLYKQARSTASIEEVAKLEDMFSAIQRLRQQVYEARRLAPRPVLDLNQAAAELRRMMNELQRVIDSKMGSPESALLRAVSERAKTLSQRSLPLHIVVAQLSTATGMKAEEILSLLLKLSQMGLLQVKVKISPLR